MRRGVVLFVLVLLFLNVKQAAAQQSTVLGRTSVQWVQILETDKNPKKRRAAIIALTVLGAAEPGVIDGLIHALKADPKAEIREAAALALGGMGADAKSAVRSLENALAKDKSAKVRTAAAKALGGDLIPSSKSTVPTLGEALKDKDAETRAQAALTLKEHGENARVVMNNVLAAAKNTKMDRFTRMYCTQILGGFAEDGPKVIPVFISILKEKDADFDLQQVAVDALARFGKEAASGTEPLVNVFENNKAPLLLRRSAAVTLVRVDADSKKVWPAAKKMMKSSQKELRSEAVRLAGALCRNEPALVDALLARCSDSNQEVRVAAIQELGELGSSARKAEKTLDNLVRTAPRRSIREAAVAALKKIRGR